MAITAGLRRLAAALQTRGLHVTWENDKQLSVANPVSSALVESVLLTGDRYLTGWAYEIGLLAEEPSAAERLAFLLGVPCSHSEASAVAAEQPSPAGPPRMAPEPG
jgi:hypothetical protein